MKKSNNKRFSIRDRAKSFAFAWNGIVLSFKSGHNIWIQAGIGVLVILFGLWLEISKTEWLIVSLTIGLVLFAEIVNTAIELLVNFVSPEYNEKAGQVKDLAAGAVLLVSISAAVVGLIIFVPRLMNLL